MGEIPFIPESEPARTVVLYFLFLTLYFGSAFLVGAVTTVK